MNIINVTGAKPYDGRYPLDLDDQPLTTREWGWIKRNAGYVPLTLTGEAFSDPELIMVLSVIAMRRAGRITTEQFAEVWDRFDDAPFGSTLTIEPDPDELDDEDDAGPPALRNSEKLELQWGQFEDRLGELGQAPESYWAARTRLLRCPSRGYRRANPDAAARVRAPVRAARRTAEMPRIAVQLVADTIQYTKGLTKAAAQTEEFGATLNKTSKGIGRSLAFRPAASSRIAGATDLLRASIDAARDTGVAQKQLAAQVKASGESWQANQAAISKAELSLEKYGFTSEDSAKALTVLERGTGKITEAMKLQGAAADLARAKNETLSDAANTLAKVFGGQETALRRAVPGLDKQAHGLDLIAEAQQRLSGQAAAGTTVSEKFEGDPP